MPDTIDPGLQKEILEALEDIKNSHQELKEENEGLQERVTAAEEENKGLREKVTEIEKAEPIHRPVTPLRWDTGMKERFGEWFLGKAGPLYNPGPVKAALQEGTSAARTEGGYLVPTEFQPEIMRILGEKSLTLQQARVFPMNRQYLEIPKAGTTGVSVAIKGEETGAAESEPTFDYVLLTAKKLNAYSVISNELIEDAAVDVVDYLTELFTEAIGEAIDKFTFSGTGDPVSGIFTSKAGYSVVMATGSLSMSQITADHLSEMISKVKPSVLNGAGWFMHPTALHYCRIIKDSQDRPIFIDSPHDAGVSKIYGYPVYVSTQCLSTATGASKAFLVFGNMRQGIAVGMRKAFTVMSDGGILQLVKQQTTIYWGTRYDSEVALPNCFVRLVSAAS